MLMRVVHAVSGSEARTMPAMLLSAAQPRIGVRQLAAALLAISPSSLRKRRQAAALQGASRSTCPRRSVTLDSMRFVAETVVHTTPAELFAFHELPDALQRLTPPWAHSRVLRHAESLHAGARVEAEVRVLGVLRFRLDVVHTRYEPPQLFEDQQTRGPFRKWRHQHIIEPHPDGAKLIDDIEFDLPFAPFSRWVAPLLVYPRLRRLFAFRHRVTRDYFRNAKSAPR
jgi:ligand-binding SRPBCC domain-containing protein